MVLSLAARFIREKLAVLKGHGVTRISINPQTMKQATLDLIGRRHTVEMVKDCFAMARAEGFDNINMDARPFHWPMGNEVKEQYKQVVGQKGIPM